MGLTGRTGGVKFHHNWWTLIGIICREIYLDPPRGAKWMVKGTIKQRLRVQTPPLGGGWYEIWFVELKPHKLFKTYFSTTRKRWTTLCLSGKSRRVFFRISGIDLCLTRDVLVGTATMRKGNKMQVASEEVFFRPCRFCSFSSFLVGGFNPCEKY